MTEKDTIERLTRLETKMEAAVITFAALTEGQISIQGLLSEIKCALAVMTSDQRGFQTYQTECEAERKAHGNRIMTLENSRSASDASRNTLMSAFSDFGGIISFLISVGTFIVLIKRG